MSSDGNFATRIRRWFAGPTAQLREWHTLDWGPIRRKMTFLSVALVISIIVVVALLIHLGLTDSFVELLALCSFPLYFVLMFASEYYDAKRSWRYALPTPDYRDEGESVQKLIFKIITETGFTIKPHEFNLWGRIGTISVADAEIHVSLERFGTPYWIFIFRMNGKVPEHVMDSIKRAFATGIEVIYTEKRFSDIAEFFEWKDEVMPEGAKVPLNAPWLEGEWELEYKSSGELVGYGTVYSRKKGERDGFFTVRDIFEDLSSYISPMPVEWFAYEGAYGAFVIVRDESTNQLIAPQKFVIRGSEILESHLGKFKCLRMEHIGDEPCVVCKIGKPEKKCIICGGKGTIHVKDERWYHEASGILVRSIRSFNHDKATRDDLVRINPLSILVETL